MIEAESSLVKPRGNWFFLNISSPLINPMVIVSPHTCLFSASFFFFFLFGGVFFFFFCFFPHQSQVFACLVPILFSVLVRGVSRKSGPAAIPIDSPPILFFLSRPGVSSFLTPQQTENRLGPCPKLYPFTSTIPELFLS